MRVNFSLKSALAIGLLVFLCGCSRTVTYTYEPSAHRPEDFNRTAQKECAKFGDHAEFAGRFWADYGRDGVNYTCIPN